MKWLSNITNPEMEFAKYMLVIPINKSRDEEWDDLLAWVADNVIGDPKGTEAYSVAELKSMNLVGVYQKDAD